MPKKDAIEVEGVVKEPLPNAMFKVELPNGHQVLATASYNAGPNRVREWLPDSKSLEADAWVDTVPYNETRNYVKNVMAFTAVYAYRLETTLRRLRERMPSVLPGGMVEMPDLSATP